MATVQDGMRVCFLYTLTLDSGEILDTTDGGEALCYVHGTGSIIPGLEQALEGMSAGDKKNVLVPAALAYGESEPDARMTAWRKRWFRLTSSGVEVADHCVEDKALEI